jgi:hypothetical protein
MSPARIVCFVSLTLSSPLQFLEDYPYFLVTAPTYSRSRDQGNQIPGLWVNNSGQLKPETAPGAQICRWSFRKFKYTNVDNSVVPWSKDP